MRKKEKKGAAGDQIFSDDGMFAPFESKKGHELNN